MEGFGAKFIGEPFVDAALFGGDGLAIFLYRAVFFIEKMAALCAHPICTRTDHSRSIYNGNARTADTFFVFVGYPVNVVS